MYVYIFIVQYYGKLGKEGPLWAEELIVKH